jgi:monofunctional glycosyltransferase
MSLVKDEPGKGATDDGLDSRLVARARRVAVGARAGSGRGREAVPFGPAQAMGSSRQAGAGGAPVQLPDGFQVSARARVVLIAVALPLAAAGALLAWWWTPSEDLDPWRNGPPPGPWAAWQRQKDRWREEGSRRGIENRYVPLAAISVELQLAALVGEDIDFFGHGPVDLDAIVEAVETRRPGTRLRGASTITQQLAKNLFLSPERSFWRKLREARLAWWMERRLGKRRILELYLNVVQFGPGLFGAEAGSRHYFGVPAGELTEQQAAGLAASIPSPGRDNPSTESRRWEFRRSVILRRMGHAEWLRNLLEKLQRPEPR